MSYLVLGLVIGFLLTGWIISSRKNAKLKRQNESLEINLDVSQAIIRESNISGKLPKDLED